MSNRLCSNEMSADRFSTEGLIRYIISVPLNFVPVVGTSESNKNVL